MHRAGIAERDIYGQSGRDLSPANIWSVLPQLEMEKAFQAAPRRLRCGIPIVRAKYGSDAGIAGAAALCRG